MIIGIDETGNFDATSNLRQIFIAALIESENGKLELKRHQFIKWDSKDHFEIRIEDIIGIIYNGFYNRGELVCEFGLLDNAKVINDAHIKIGFLEFDAERKLKS